MTTFELIACGGLAVIVYQLGWLIRNSERALTRLDKFTENTLDIDRMKREGRI